jgi:hypothetical protein
MVDTLVRNLSVFEFHRQFKEACLSRSHFEIMFLCFFDHKRIIHYEFVAQGQMVNQQCYFKVLTRLWKSVWKKRPKLWPDNWIFHHNNSPAHDALKA